MGLAGGQKKLERRLKRNYYYFSREWPYKNVTPRLMAEHYLEDDVTHDARDYKFFCFSGKAKAMFIASDRLSDEETKFDFYDMDGLHLPFTNGHPNASPFPALPVHFKEMQYLAEKLSAGIPHVRVDFYEVNGKVYFGELTFSHWMGMVPFDPPEWDRIFGDWIEIGE